MSQIAEKLAGMGDRDIDETHVADAIGRFSKVAAALTTPEKVRLLELLIERISYDRAKETVAITFRPSGFDAILEETT